MAAVYDTVLLFVTEYVLQVASSINPLPRSRPGFSKCLSKTAIQKFLPLQIQLLCYFKSLKQLDLLAFCVKKGNLYFGHVFNDGLL